jgi:hypothetical protein
MRSPRAFAASATVLASIVGGIAAGATLGDAASRLVIHFGVGAGFILLATAAFDFPMPRWASWIGALSAGAFGAIFVLQGIADLLPGVTVLQQLAFDTLGHEVERILPDVVYVWFAALLIWASSGRTRILGAIVMTVVIGLEVATGLGALLGVSVPTIKILLFVPFVWLLFEAAKRASTGEAKVADTPARVLASG